MKGKVGMEKRWRISRKIVKKSLLGARVDVGRRVEVGSRAEWSWERRDAVSSCSATE